VFVESCYRISAVTVVMRNARFICREGIGDICFSHSGIVRNSRGETSKVEKVTS
jgi:hypothetical protein